jgi:hypothetical protein
MSKYLAFTEAVFKDRELLVSALAELGCANVQQGKDLPLGRYWAEQTAQTADLIIPRYTIGNNYGDIGFVRGAEGSYSVILDDLDQARVLDGKFLPRLRTAYHEQAVAQIAARLRGTMQRSTQGHVHKIKVRF